MATKMDRDMKKWEAEHDARTLADAAAIQADRKRMGAAKTAAKRIEAEAQQQAKQQQARARQLSRLAGKKNGARKGKGSSKVAAKPRVGGRRRR